MKFIVSTDAAADLDIEYASKNDIRIISMSYYFVGETPNREHTFGNGEEGPTIQEFYTELRNGKQAKTVLINAEQHKEYFSKLLKEGKDIVHIPLSSGLSGTSECAVQAAEELKESYPDRKIIIINFNGASMGQGLFVDHVARLRDEGKNALEVEEWAKANILKFCHYFTVDDLNHLRRGGRVSGVAAFIGSLIKIKPLLHVDDNGKLIPVEKNIGRKKALLNLVAKMKSLAIEGNQRVFISHGDCYDDAKFVADNITEALGITDIKIGFIGPIIGAHSGPGTVALFFIGSKR